MVPAQAIRELAPTGALRAAINFGNAVLARKDPATGEPKGVSAALARELATRLGLPVRFVPYDAAGKVTAAARTGVWDVAFLAIDPLRAADIAFTPPYVLIEGTYLVRSDSPLRAIGDFDREGIRIAVGEGSAYHLYLKGRYFLNRRRPGDLKLAIEHFERAIEADPGYAEPHVGIAGTFGVLGLWDYVPSGEAFGRVKTEAMQALALDDSLCEAHMLLAWVLAVREWDWEGANRHFERARRLPAVGGFAGVGMSLCHVVAGHPREALLTAREIAEREPLSSIAQTQAAATHVAFGEIAQAVQFLERALELDPAMPMALLWLGFCRAVQGRLEEAETLLRESSQQGLPSPTYLAAVLARAGKMEEARAVVRAVDEDAGKRYVSRLTLAGAHAAIGEKECSLALLEQAEQERSAAFTLSVFGPGYLSLSPDWVKEWFAACHDRIGPADPRTELKTSDRERG